MKTTPKTASVPKKGIGRFFRRLFWPARKLAMRSTALGFLWDLGINVLKVIALLCIAYPAVLFASRFEFGQRALIAILVVAITIAVSIPFLVMGLYHSAQQNKWFTFIRTGEIKFRRWGGSIDKVFVNVPGFRYDRAQDLLVEGNEPMFGAWIKAILPKFSKDFRKDMASDKQQGIGYVSVWWPIGSILKWEFTWPKLESKTHDEPGKQKMLDGYVIVEKTSEVDSLFAEYNYPIEAKDIELVGLIQVTVLTRVIIRVRKPMHLIGFLKGKFMPQVISEIRGIIDNGIRDMNIEQWRECDKKAKIEALLKKGLHVLEGDMVIIESSYICWDYGSNSAELKSSFTAKEKARLDGDAKIEAAAKAAIEEESRNKLRVTKAEGDAKVAVHEAAAKLTTATGEAAGKKVLAEANAFEIQQTLKMAAGHEQGVDLLIARQNREAIASFKGDTLVMGSSNALIGVNGRSKGPKPDAEPSEKKEAA